MILPAATEREPDHRAHCAPRGTRGRTAWPAQPSPRLHSGILGVRWGQNDENGWLTTVTRTRRQQALRKTDKRRAESRTSGSHGGAPTYKRLPRTETIPALSARQEHVPRCRLPDQRLRARLAGPAPWQGVRPATHMTRAPRCTAEAAESTSNPIRRVAGGQPAN